MLLSTFTKTSVGYTLKLSLDPSKVSTGYESYDLAIRFDPTKARLSNTSFDFPGEIKSINDSGLSNGVLLASGLTLTNRIAAATPLVTLNFVSDSTTALSVVVNKLNVNGTSYLADSNALTLSSGSAASGGGSLTDTVAPTVVSSDPASGGSVAANKEFLSLTFSEAIAKGSGSIQIKTAAGVVVESFDITALGRLAIAGATLTIDPTLNLLPGTSYVLSVPAGTIKDVSGNGLASAYNVSFTSLAASLDIIAPVITSRSPIADATSVATSSIIVIRFSEAVALSTGTIQLLTASGTVVQSFGATQAGVTVLGDTLTITPSLPLTAATDYRLSISATAIKDLSGNAFAGLSNTGFRTAAVTAGDLTVTVDKTSVDEGGLLTFSIDAPTRTAGTTLQYQITGVVKSDINKTLTGTLTVSTSKTAQLLVKVTSDSLTEGSESLTLLVEGVPVVVTINDTSVSSIPQAFVGSAKNETFKLSSAVDSVNGGIGIDNAYVNGVSTDYTIRIGSGKVFLSQQSSLNIDTLQGVERIEFSDKSVALDIDGNGGNAYRIYKAAFNRQPDNEGIGYWIAQLDAGATLLSVATGFVYSPEFATVYGRKPSNSAFLLTLYNNVLSRAPDTTGYTWWLNEMNTNSSKSMAQVLADFAGSSENKLAVTELIANGIDYAPWFG